MTTFLISFNNFHYTGSLYAAHHASGLDLGDVISSQGGQGSSSVGRTFQRSWPLDDFDQGGLDGFITEKAEISVFNNSLFLNLSESVVTVLTINRPWSSTRMILEPACHSSWTL